MATEIIIRAIRDADFPAYKALRLEALRSHPEVFGSDFADQVNDPDSVWTNRIRSSVEGKSSRMLLADAGSELAGMSAVYRDVGRKVCHSATIASVYVRPQWRGQRLSERLIQEALAWCAAEQVRIARLSVITGNASAIRCYHRLGFQVCGVQPEVNRVGDVFHDELLMWRRISKE